MPEKPNCLADVVRAVNVIYIDFSKNFNSVSHNGLASKLDYECLDGQTTD